MILKLSEWLKFNQMFTMIWQLTSNDASYINNLIFGKWADVFMFFCFRFETSFLLVVENWNNYIEILHCLKKYCFYHFSKDVILSLCPKSEWFDLIESIVFRWCAIKALDFHHLSLILTETSETGDGATPNFFFVNL